MPKGWCCGGDLQQKQKWSWEFVSPGWVLCISCSLCRFALTHYYCCPFYSASLPSLQSFLAPGDQINLIRKRGMWKWSFVQGGFNFVIDGLWAWSLTWDGRGDGTYCVRFIILILMDVIYLFVELVILTIKSQWADEFDGPRPMSFLIFTGWVLQNFWRTRWMIDSNLPLDLVGNPQLADVGVILWGQPWPGCDPDQAWGD